MIIKDQTGVQETPVYSADSGVSKRMGLLFINSLFRFGLQIVVIILFARRLPVTDYGLYQSVWLYTNVISVISLFGLPSVILSIGVSNVSTWIKNNFVLSTIAFLLLYVSPLAYVFLTDQVFSENTKILLIILIILQNVSIITESVTIKNTNENTVLLVNIIFSAAYLFCHVEVLKDYSLDRLLSWLCFVFALKSLLLKLFNKKNIIHQNNVDIHQTGKQWLFLGLFDVVSVIFKWIDKWFILFFVSVTGFAVYFNGAYEIPLFALLVSAAGNIMVVELAKQPQLHPEQINRIFNDTFIFLAGIIFPSFAFLLFYHYEFFILIFTGKYIESIPVFIVSIFVIPVRVCNYTAALQVYHRNHIILNGAILDLAAAILMIAILYPFFGFPGVAAAFVLSTYLQVAFYLWHTSELSRQRITKFVPVRHLSVILILSLLITAGGYYLNPGLHHVKLIPGIIICITLICIFTLRYFKKRV